MDMALYRRVIKAREEMLEALKSGERSWTSTACINIVFEDCTHISTNQACHAGLHYYERKLENKKPVAVVNALMKPYEEEMLAEDEAMMFLDWLLNRSPYHTTFISKDPRECLLHKATISTAFAPSNLMAAGMVASRRLWEYQEVARVFCDLVKAGVQEDLAFYLAHIARCAFARSGKIDWSGCKFGHCSINGKMTRGALLNYLNHDVQNANKNYHEYKSYTGYCDMYNGGDGSWAHKWIDGNFQYGKGEAAKNPFARAGDAIKSDDYADGIKKMAEFQHKILEWVGFTKVSVEKAA